jgi:hypothetical protein
LAQGLPETDCGSVSRDPDKTACPVKQMLTILWAGFLRIRCDLHESRLRHASRAAGILENSGGEG